MLAALENGSEAFMLVLNSVPDEFLVGTTGVTFLVPTEAAFENMASEYGYGSGLAFVHQLPPLERQVLAARHMVNNNYTVSAMVTRGTVTAADAEELTVTEVGEATVVSTANGRVTAQVLVNADSFAIPNHAAYLIDHVLLTLPDRDGDTVLTGSNGGPVKQESSNKRASVSVVLAVAVGAVLVAIIVALAVTRRRALVAQIDEDMLMQDADVTPEPFGRRKTTLWSANEAVADNPLSHHGELLSSVDNAGTSPELYPTTHPNFFSPTFDTAQANPTAMALAGRSTKLGTLGSSAGDVGASEWARPDPVSALLDQYKDDDDAVEAQYWQLLSNHSGDTMGQSAQHSPQSRAAPPLRAVTTPRQRSVELAFTPLSDSPHTVAAANSSALDLSLEAPGEMEPAALEPGSTAAKWTAAAPLFTGLAVKEPQETRPTPVDSREDSIATRIVREIARLIGDTTELTGLRGLLGAGSAGTARAQGPAPSASASASQDQFVQAAAAGYSAGMRGLIQAQQACIDSQHSLIHQFESLHGVPAPAQQLPLRNPAHFYPAQSAATEPALVGAAPAWHAAEAPSHFYPTQVEADHIHSSMAEVNAALNQFRN